MTVEITEAVVDDLAAMMGMGRIAPNRIEDLCREIVGRHADPEETVALLAIMAGLVVGTWRAKYAKEEEFFAALRDWRARLLS